MESIFFRLKLNKKTGILIWENRVPSSELQAQPENKIVSTVVYFGIDILENLTDVRIFFLLILI